MPPFQHIVNTRDSSDQAGALLWGTLVGSRRDSSDQMGALHGPVGDSRGQQKRQQRPPLLRLHFSQWRDERTEGGSSGWTEVLPVSSQCVDWTLQVD